MIVQNDYIIVIVKSPDPLAPYQPRHKRQLMYFIPYTLAPDTGVRMYSQFRTPGATRRLSLYMYKPHNTMYMITIQAS